MAEGAAGSGKKIRNLSWAETWLQNEYPERHVTQGSQNSNPAGICFPLWINYVTWRECPAGNLSRGFQLQVEGTAWENKPKYENPPLFSATGLKIPWFSPASDMNCFGFLACFRAWYETVLLSQRRSSASCYSCLSQILMLCATHTAEQQIHCTNPKAPFGKILIFPIIHFLSRLKQGSEKPRKIQKSVSLAVDTHLGLP